MLLAIQCPIEGAITAEVTFPYYFFKPLKPITDENENTCCIIGVVAEGVCFTITISHNEQG